MQILISMHFAEMFAFTLHVSGIILRIPSHLLPYSLDITSAHVKQDILCPLCLLFASCFCTVPLFLVSVKQH